MANAPVRQVKANVSASASILVAIPNIAEAAVANAHPHSSVAIANVYPPAQNHKSPVMANASICAPMPKIAANAAISVKAVNCVSLRNASVLKAKANVTANVSIPAETPNIADNAITNARHLKAAQVVAVYPLVCPDKLHVQVFASISRQISPIVGNAT
jgi:hypothetical protein